jgi:hypothetical protein
VTLGRGLRLADVPNLVSYQLGEHIRLIGYGWDRDGATLTLYWQSNRQPPAGGGEVEADYVVFVHVLDQQGRLIWGADGPPLGGLYPTSAWRSGEIVADPRPLGLEELPPGTYTLEVGLYHPASLARLPVSDEHGQPVADDAIPLTRLTWP